MKNVTKLSFNKAVLLVIDVQNDFCAKDGIIAKSGRNISSIEKAIKNLQRVIDEARNNRIPIIFFRLVYDPKKIPQTHIERLKIKNAKGLCRPRSRGIAFYKVKPAPKWGDMVFEKNYYSAFQQTPLDTWLKKHQINTIIVTGVTTHICPLLTCADAYYRGYNIIALQDCLGTYEGQRFALRYMKEQFNAQVIDAKKLIKQFQQTI